MGRKERRAKERQERKESICMTPDRIYELKQKTANEAVRRVQEIEKGKEKQRAETALDMLLLFGMTYLHEQKGCPVCGKENWICKSIAMEMGINTGHGACLGCKTFLHITFNPERQEMDLERFEDYEKSQKARDDVDKIAGNPGYGGQDNG